MKKGFKTFLALICLILMLSLFACGGGSSKKAYKVVFPNSSGEGYKITYSITYEEDGDEYLVYEDANTVELHVEMEEGYVLNDFKVKHNGTDVLIRDVNGLTAYQDALDNVSCSKSICYEMTIISDSTISITGSLKKATVSFDVTLDEDYTVTSIVGDKKTTLTSSNNTVNCLYKEPVYLEYSSNDMDTSFNGSSIEQDSDGLSVKLLVNNDGTPINFGGANSLAFRYKVSVSSATKKTITNKPTFDKDLKAISLPFCSLYTVQDSLISCVSDVYINPDEDLVVYLRCNSPCEWNDSLSLKLYDYSDNLIATASLSSEVVAYDNHKYVFDKSDLTDLPSNARVAVEGVNVENRLYKICHNEPGIEMLDVASVESEGFNRNIVFLNDEPYIYNENKFKVLLSYSTYLFEKNPEVENRAYYEISGTKYYSSEGDDFGYYTFDLNDCDKLSESNMIINIKTDNVLKKKVFSITDFVASGVENHPYSLYAATLDDNGNVISTSPFNSETKFGQNIKLLAVPNAGYYFDNPRMEILAYQGNSFSSQNVRYNLNPILDNDTVRLYNFNYIEDYQGIMFDVNISENDVSGIYSMIGLENYSLTFTLFGLKNQDKLTATMMDGYNFGSITEKTINRNEKFTFDVYNAENECVSSDVYAYIKPKDYLLPHKMINMENNSFVVENPEYSFEIYVTEKTSTFNVTLPVLTNATYNVYVNHELINLTNNSFKVTKYDFYEIIINANDGYKFITSDAPAFAYMITDYNALNDSKCYRTYGSGISEDIQYEFTKLDSPCEEDSFLVNDDTVIISLIDSKNTYRNNPSTLFTYNDDQGTLSFGDEQAICFERGSDITLNLYKYNNNFSLRNITIKVFDDNNNSIPYEFVDGVLTISNLLCNISIMVENVELNQMRKVTINHDNAERIYLPIQLEENSYSIDNAAYDVKGYNEYIFRGESPVNFLIEKIAGYDYSNALIVINGVEHALTDYNENYTFYKLSSLDEDIIVSIKGIVKKAFTITIPADLGIKVYNKETSSYETKTSVSVEYGETLRFCVSTQSKINYCGKVKNSASYFDAYRLVDSNGEIIESANGVYEYTLRSITTDLTIGTTN